MRTPPLLAKLQVELDSQAIAARLCKRPNAILLLTRVAHPARHRTWWPEQRASRPCFIAALDGDEALVRVHVLHASSTEEGSR